MTVRRQGEKIANFGLWIQKRFTPQKWPNVSSNIFNVDENEIGLNSSVTTFRLERRGEGVFI